jgi:LacI family gluconate utilization system Gnt-I transcriptional repressor
VPRDIAVIGFGDSDFASELNPSLTSVKIDGKAIGQQSAAFLMKRAQGQKIKERIVDVGFELIIRGSG